MAVGYDPLHWFLFSEIRWERSFLTVSLTSMNKVIKKNMFWKFILTFQMFNGLKQGTSAVRNVKFNDVIDLRFPIASKSQTGNIDITDSFRIQKLISWFCLNTNESSATRWKSFKRCFNETIYEIDMLLMCRHILFSNKKLSFQRKMAEKDKKETKETEVLS